jgi:hypothetical protein
MEKVLSAFGNSKEFTDTYGELSQDALITEYKKNKRPIQALTYSTWQASGSRLSIRSASLTIILRAANNSSLSRKLELIDGKGKLYG